MKRWIDYDGKKEISGVVFTFDQIKREKKLRCIFADPINECITLFETNCYTLTTYDRFSLRKIDSIKTVISKGLFRSGGIYWIYEYK
jgi:hypothetical protein